MKHGDKGAGKSARAKESPASHDPAMAVPYPSGASPVVAEEARSLSHFTSREKEVGGWLAEGKSDPEIAGILEMGVETVRTHIKSMRLKVGAYNRNVLFAWIWRNRCAFYLHQSAGRKPVKYT